MDRREAGTILGEPAQGRGAGVAVCRGTGQANRGADRTSTLCAWRHFHGTVGPGTEESGGRLAIRVDVAPVSGDRRKREGRALVSRRIRRQSQGGAAVRGALPEVRPGGPDGFPPTKSALLLCPDRPLREPGQSSRMERDSNGATAR